MASSTCWIAGRTVAGGVRGGGWRWPGLPGEGEEVVAFGVVELQGDGEGVEDAVGGAGEVAAFHADVVVDRDAGEHGDLLAAQAFDAAVAAVRGQSALLGGDACAPRC